MFYRRSNGQFILHRAVKVKNGIYTMSEITSGEKERGIAADMIIGVVTELKRGGTPVDINAVPYRVLPPAAASAYIFVFKRQFLFVLRRIKRLFK